MMNVFSCVPNWGGVREEGGERELILALKARVEEWLAFREHEGEKPYELSTSRFELDEKQLLRILRRCRFNVQASLTEWTEWITWREEVDANSITGRDFESNLTPLSIAKWCGKDKEGRPALVLTGRLLRSDFKFKSIRLFRRYLVFMAERGVHLCNEQGAERACIIYDRRMLDFHHCDAELHNACKPWFNQIRRFYGDRIGNIYILHMNWLFHNVFLFILSPLIGLMRREGSANLYAVQSAEELEQYFELDQLKLNNTPLEEEQVHHLAVETEDLVVDELYGIRAEGIRLPGGTIMTGIPAESAAPILLPS